MIIKLLLIYILFIFFVIVFYKIYDRMLLVRMFNGLKSERKYGEAEVLELDILISREGING